MRGRKAEPAEIKEAKGDPGKRGVNVAGESAAPSSRELPPCPEHLTGYARECWDRLADLLSWNKVLKISDLTLFESFCSTYDDYRNAIDGLERDGMTYETKSKHGTLKRISPWFKIKHDSQRQLRQLGEQFGLTPSMRQRLFIGATRDAPPKNSSDKGPDLFGKAGPDAEAAAGAARPDASKTVGFLH